MVSNITPIDVKIVAQKLRLSLSDEEINVVMHRYNEEEECDPTAYWAIIVENCIYNVVNERSSTAS